MSKKSQEPRVGSEELRNLESQMAQLTEALQRERADAVNARARFDQQLAGLKDVTKVAVVRELLPVVDNFERSLLHIPKDIAHHDFVKGVSGIVKQFEKVLSDMGVKRIKTVGEVFDPNLHEAVSMDEGQGSKEVVTEELQAGYTLQDTVLRHAMVRVSRK